MKTDTRRVPRQERSRRRFDRILEVAAEAFAAQGFDATKMESIAEDAGTSIGSVYQFFANKRALFRAVADGCIERSRQTFAERLAGDAIRKPWDVLVDEMVETFARLHRADAAFRALIANIQLYKEFAAADQELLNEFTMTTALLVGRWAPHIEPKRREVISTVVVNGIAGLLVAGSRLGPKKFDAMLAEIKLMVRRYLEPELGMLPAAEKG